LIDFLLLLIVPLLLSITALIIFKGRITIVEFLCQVGILMVFVGACLGIAYWSKTSDTELLNGQITGLGRVEVSCSHSYQCHCHQVCSGSGNNRSCSEECDTCYEHSYDVDWRVYSNIGQSINIGREDRQGLIEPKRWDKAFAGEPFTITHSYENYIMANPDSVLTGGKGNVEFWKKLIPEYPGTFDYYKSNHFINMGVPNIDFNTWNWLVNEANKTLGPKKQVNLLVIVVPTDSSAYVQALKTAWIGGKKNDAIIVIGSKDGHNIAFVEVVSWAVHADFRDNLRTDIMMLGSLDKRDEIMQAVYDETNGRFVRMHMKDMQYLMRSFQPSGTAMWVIFILSTLLSTGISFGFLYYYADEHRWTPSYKRSRIYR
jgi:hypothetical protein